MADFIDVCVNCPDRVCAERIAEDCIEKHLAACANILSPISSIYRWKGAVERAEEVPLLLKSRANLFDCLAARIRELHPYEVPSIVASELKLVDPAYGAWIKHETNG